MTASIPHFQAGGRARVKNDIKAVEARLRAIQEEQDKLEAERKFLKRILKQK